MAAYKSGLNEKVQEGIQVLRQQFPNSFDK
jgi:hypothetical protein